MLVIGLTGGIGSGKSTVAKLFIERGVTVIDSDKLARDVVLPGQAALKQVAEKFGSAVMKPDGTLDRNALRKIIFEDENSRNWLEQLLHPLIRAEMKKQIKNANPPYCIIMIPLLLETENNPLIDRILVVDSAEADQIKRTQKRDNATEEEVKSIIKTQVSRTKRLSAADDVIENSGSISDLIPQIDRLHGFYSALSQKSVIK